MTEGRTRVLYVAGSGRSGSTIVANVLGQLDGYVSVGEMTYLWQRSLIEGRLCGCGETGTGCPFWSEVLKTAYNDDVPDPQAMVRAAAGMTRVRHTPLLLSRWGRARLAGSAPDYRTAMAALYQATGEVSGGDVVVDSSKFPGYGKVATGLDGIDATVLHLIRDSRAVAFSWQRKVLQPDTDERRYMMQRRPATVAMRWMAANLSSELFWRDGSARYIRMRYEDFVADPASRLQDVVDMVGVRANIGDVVEGQVALLGPTHTISGNPSRFTTGSVELRLDDEWRRSLPGQTRYGVAAITSPLLLRYRYLG